MSLIYKKVASGFVVLLGLALMMSACAPAEPGMDALQQNLSSGRCDVGSDQVGSFLPALPTRKTVKVSVDASFSPEEKAAISAALEEWNGWSEEDLGRSFFDGTTAVLDSDFIPESGDDPCDFSAPAGLGGFAVIRVSDPKVWEELSLTNANPAATLRCRSGDRLTRQVMLVRADLVRSEQWKSVVLHELGHAVGLDHSCNLSAGTDDYLSCAGLGSDHPYRTAVMFPKLSVGSSSTGRGAEVKEALQENDRLRASCLYGGRS